MCKGKLLIGFPILLFVSILMGNSFVDNGPNPGELYIIGPDISPDSSEYTFLYYSPDSGRTLIVKDTLSEVLSIAADESSAVVYLADFSRTYCSFDFGETFEEIYPHEGILYSGVTTGELCHGFGGRWIFGFGDSVYVGGFWGWPGPVNGEADVGVKGEMCIFLRTTGQL